MWWVGTRSKRTLDVYLSTQGFAACRDGVREMGQITPTLESALSALRMMIAKDRSVTRLRLYLSASLCRPFIVTLPPMSSSETQTAIQAAARTRTGLVGRLRVWSSRTGSGGSVIAAAVEEALLLQLKDLEKAGHRLQLLSIGPAWAEWLRVRLASQPETSCVVLQECDSVTLLSGDGGKFLVAACRPLSHDERDAGQALARMMLSVDDPIGTPAQARMRIDAFSPIERLGSALAPLLDVAP